MCKVYLKADRVVEVRTPKVCVGDIAKVYCSVPEVSQKIRETPLFTFHMEEKGRKVTVSILYVIARITEFIKNENGQCPSTESFVWDIQNKTPDIYNIGPEDFVMNLRFYEKAPKKSPLWKVAAIVLITFFGSAFSIMTYNEDVDTLGVFEKINTITGAGDIGMALLMIAYAIGVGAGVIIFFNHFGKKKLTSDPTPMEVEMEKYEADVADTWIKQSVRNGDGIDIS